MNPTPLIVLAGLMLLTLGFWGCAAMPAGAPGVRAEAAAVSATQTPEPVEAAWVWGEAELPEGFPPPGPVGQIIVKEYPAYRAAVAQSAVVGSADMNQLFRPLFNHIKKNDIAMTAPVEMTYDPMTGAAGEQPHLNRMAFMYADTQLGQPGAQGQVMVTDYPPVTVLSLGLRGSYNEKNFRAGLQQLEEFLRTHAPQYAPAGPPRFLGYNSPFVPWFMKYGEVQIPVRRIVPELKPAP